MNPEKIKTEVMELPIELQCRLPKSWRLRKSVWRNLRMRSEREQNSLFDTRMPNEETLKAIDEAEKGICLIECENADDLFRKLGI